MHIKFLFFTNVIIVFANNVSWANQQRHRFYDQQLSSRGKNDSKLITRESNKELQLQELKKDKPIIKQRVDEKEETETPWSLSKENDRLQFHIQGHEGPQTYIFGFDTGYGKNRQYRLEERHRDGTIKGQYGYYDAKGKLRTVRYIAKPFEGYTEIHHESNMDKLIS
ncbi:uncharacterized protein LOC100875945 [Megachile rotundata]|uniref:uncharacterized protein LOC100875945 n=1 Tax=Megachile rotundata TaxID=143995 RepID=UPI000614C7D0|nr:PREDICTED: uncharacterized protein LOC100875945 [Megachile rotundata]